LAVCRPPFGICQEELLRKAKNGKTPEGEQVVDYRHKKVKRLNIPPAGLAARGELVKEKQVRFAYNPHLTPTLRFDAEGKADKIAEFVDATSPSRSECLEGRGAASTMRSEYPEGRGGDAASTGLFFDPREPTGRLSGGNLPHWRQGGVTYFVTFRTADSMPRERVEQWFRERDAWLKSHPEPHDAMTRTEYHRLFSARWESWLDEANGERLLARAEIRSIVEDALRHYDGTRYQLDEFVVMPNHVHVLVTPNQGRGGDAASTLSSIVQGWKSFTAHEINKLLERKGGFWQKESFDHIVRSLAQLERIRQYIRQNPVDATSPSRSQSPEGRGGDAASTTPLPASTR
jgi:type I restriction enzyme R subunit